MTAKCLSFTANKVVVLVRNPLDVIVNYANQVNTMSHELKPEYSYDKDFAEWWKWWVKYHCNIQKTYFDTLKAHAADVSIHYVRYEDLVSNTKAELASLMKFVLDLNDLTDTNAERRINTVVQE